MKIRCDWVPEKDELYCLYHDTEWGVPVHDDQKLFEFLILETFQAGLSWKTVLYKRDNFRKAFAGFNFKKVAAFTEKDQQRLLNDSGIIRNRLKIKAAISNARTFLKVIDEFGSFDAYIWGFVNYKVIDNKFKQMSDLPAKTEISDKISADLKKRGFKFVGSTVVYAHMQATGMVNDHTIDCFRYKEVQKMSD
jgi:DNA-3-methyladenine glycosylase I